MTIIELLLHIFCEEIKSQRLCEQHPSWGPAVNLSEDLKTLLDTISKIHLSERPPSNSSRVISECAQVTTIHDINIPLISYPVLTVVMYLFSFCPTNFLIYKHILVT